VTRDVFVRKQVMISFDVLFVILSYLLLTFVRRQYINKICVTVVRNVTQNCCQNRCMFNKVAILFFMKALLEQRVRE